MMQMYVYFNLDTSTEILDLLQQVSSSRKTWNANGVCSHHHGGGSGETGAPTLTSLLTRSGAGLHRRLNAVVRDRIVFFTSRRERPRTTAANS